MLPPRASGAHGAVGMRVCPAPCCEDPDGEGRQHQGDNDPGQPCCPCHSVVVHGCQEEDGCDGDGPFPACGGRVGRKRHGHGRSASTLADHKAPSGQEAGPWTKAFAAIGVGPAGGRVHGSQLRGRCRIAESEGSCNNEANQQARSSRRGGRGKRCEDPRANHGTEPNHCRIHCAQPSGEGRRIAHGFLSLVPVLLAESSEEHQHGTQGQWAPGAS